LEKDETKDSTLKGYLFSKCRDHGYHHQGAGLSLHLTQVNCPWCERNSLETELSQKRDYVRTASGGLERRDKLERKMKKLLVEVGRTEMQKRLKLQDQISAFELEVDKLKGETDD
jgi:hypothetical protein